MQHVHFNLFQRLNNAAQALIFQFSRIQISFSTTSFKSTLRDGQWCVTIETFVAWNWKLFAETLFPAVIEGGKWGLFEVGAIFGPGLLDFKQTSMICSNIEIPHFRLKLNIARQEQRRLVFCKFETIFFVLSIKLHPLYLTPNSVCQMIPSPPVPSPPLVVSDKAQK